MENFGFYSYLSACISYTLILLFILFFVKKNIITFIFGLAIALSIAWSIASVITIRNDDTEAFSITLILGTLRNTCWYLLLSVLVSRQQSKDSFFIIKTYWQSKATIAAIAFVLIIEFYPHLVVYISRTFAVDLRFISRIVLSIIGLMLIEQLYRNSKKDQLWHVKFLCISLAAIFIVDFIVYSKSSLFLRLDLDIWYSRGFIHAFLMPLFMISAYRVQHQAAQFNVSNHVIFYTSVLLSSGVYLALMSLMGIYIKDYGGSWGQVAQTTFIALAIIMLTVFFVSSKVRAWGRVYLSKHFFEHRYNYRDEWIKLSNHIAQLQNTQDVSGFVIKTLADLVDTDSGGLWLKNEQGDYYLSASHGFNFANLQLISRNDSMIVFFKQKKWVVDFVEFVNDPEVYSDLSLEPWYLGSDKNIWAMVPLLGQNELEAFVALGKPRIMRQMDWEDRDLLKTVGMQLANALALIRASEELSRVKQFEAYNRLSAFLAHDLKNLVAQIALIVKNAEKHKHNPEFIDDSIATLENVVLKVQRILAQLQGHSKQQSHFKTVDLLTVLQDVQKHQSQNKPMPHLNTDCQDCLLFGDSDKLFSTISHLVQNAQEATPENGSVELQLFKSQQQAIIKIIDTGCGMEQAFIENRLFKPFDTTKGNAGMGIGVYEAREYVLQHSGSISVTSRPGQGTTFTLAFPT